MGEVSVERGSRAICARVESHSWGAVGASHSKAPTHKFLDAKGSSFHAPACPADSIIRLTPHPITHLALCEVLQRLYGGAVLVPGLGVPSTYPITPRTWPWIT